MLIKTCLGQGVFRQCIRIGIPIPIILSKSRIKQTIDSLGCQLVNNHLG